MYDFKVHFHVAFSYFSIALASENVLERKIILVNFQRPRQTERLQNVMQKTLREIASVNVLVQHEAWIKKLQVFKVQLEIKNICSKVQLVKTADIELYRPSVDYEENYPTIISALPSDKHSSLLQKSISLFSIVIGDK